MRRMGIQGITIGAAVLVGGGPWIVAGIALAIAGVAAAGFRRLRGTTLSAPAAWALAAALGVAVVEAGLAWRGELADSMTASLWRYAAAAGTFCPLMGVLGAKRPQDRGWQWVVLSLWVILLVPALQAVAARSGTRLELYGAWRLLLAALIAVGLLNYLPTRYALAAVLFAIGQALLFAPYLITIESSGDGPRIIGLALILAASALALVIESRRVLLPSDDGEPSIARFNARWFAFRDGWGAFWGLRVMQRVNQTAELSGWPVRLEWWEGFVPIAEGGNLDAKDIALDAETAAHIQQTLDSLLRRFERLDSAEVRSNTHSH
jgi:hypothetical protein